MEKYSKQQKEIATMIDSDDFLDKWKDWNWQLKHSIRDIETFERLLGINFEPPEKEKLKETLEKFPLSITPYYLSLIDSDDFRNDPIFLQSFPSPEELIISADELEDPLSEDTDSPVEGITHRYPDRVLFHISNVCSMYCRHCTRKRKVGDIDYIPEKEKILEGIEYIRNTPQIRDVLLSGGDPLMLSDDFLDWILTEINSIPHVEVIRIGSRMPVVLPYRITDELVDVLKKHHPIWLNTHFNHPREMTFSSRQALKKLADAGIPLGNQTVLLAGVNDCQRIIKKLVHKLVQNRVRPYYLYQCDLSEGLSHFRTPIGKGIEIMENLIGHTSGFSVPTYVIDAPHGGGKIPVMPNYIISWSTNRVILRNYEGVITSYKEPESYKQIYCDRNCEKCDLQLKLDDATEYKAIGISKLLADYDDTTSLVPEDNERMERRT
ncbi:lysine 2,3-aminomutase [Methanococcoides burtonii]|uniref:L-lysine 2,3-aminomutase n=1 Tax=Methanococcoides burtonii (strain DSM 6242 / NBRC 107633 / OCM 468 / ACE-M) TaxID=259564 RepID=Q12Z47_METBU|nr:lysine 2,3-aminomutase [Methanococcoides burtonii]ABE51279.1 L-lysine 2,3-aminomutase [Methanococcoides burtonii DSM 6242]